MQKCNQDLFPVEYCEHGAAVGRAWGAVERFTRRNLPDGFVKGFAWLAG